MSGKVGNNEYVQIGTLKWQRRNLNVSTYRNGDVIPYVADNTKWANLTTGAWCYISNDPELGKIYGKMYNWYAVSDPRGLAPTGWRIPTYAEWYYQISQTLGTNAGGRLKQTGTVNWSSPNTGATNDIGFTGLPSGLRSFSDGTFVGIGIQGRFWTSTQSSTLPVTNAIVAALAYNSAALSFFGPDKKTGYPVRCIID